MSVSLLRMAKRAKPTSLRSTKAPKAPKPATGVPNLEAWRLFRGMTQEVLAAKVGLSQGRISQLESGDDQVTWATIKMLAIALDTTPQELVASPPGEDSLYGAVAQLPKVDHPRAIRIIKSLRDPE